MRGNSERVAENPYLEERADMIKTIAIIMTLAACGSDKRADPKAEPAPIAKVDPLEQRCVEWGASYYKAIGSHPTLTDGSSADDEAKARCKRSIDAYPNPKIAETERAIDEAIGRAANAYGSTNAAKTMIANASYSADPTGTKAQGESALAAAEAEGNAAWAEAEALKRTLARLRAESR